MAAIRTILCPVDFFSASLRACDYAIALAARHGAGLHVLHVVSPFITAAYGAPIEATEVTADLEKHYRTRLQKLLTKAHKAGVRAKSQVKVGDTDLEIRQTLDKSGFDLVVMGTHGRRGFEHWVLGSVTERMIRHCPVPLLTIGPGGRVSAGQPAFKKILVTTDFSDGTGTALAHAFSIAREYHSKVTLLHVVNDALADVTGTYRESLLSGVEKKLDALIPKNARNSRGVETRIATGLPFRMIPEIIKSGKYDLLVMNIHGKTLLERALIGSTAERVVRAVSNICPILLIPPARTSRPKRRSASGKA